MTARFSEIKLELLRHGPAHNQLLSPLTRYLAVCGDHEPVTVNLPWEHRDWLPKLRSLRYDDLSARGPDPRREDDLRVVREAVSEFLEGTGLSEELASGDGSWTHLRLMVTPQELSMLPFELLVTPAGVPGAGLPLLLNPKVPVVLTREVRKSHRRRFDWPSDMRVLFVTAEPGALTVPVQAHYSALYQAIKPWAPPNTGLKDDRGVLICDNRGLPLPDLAGRLDVVKAATLEDIRDRCQSTSYTHVHVLVHGAAMGDGRFGLALHGSGDDMEVVDGETLGLALRTQRDDGTFSHPAVVSLATCDSGNIGDVVQAGASVAHDLHTAGIPLVVASQYPLTKEGSVRLVQELYRPLLAGMHPLPAMRAARERLHARQHASHDWASLVVYATLPPDLAAQLQGIRLGRLLAAMDNAHQWAEAALDEGQSLPSGEAVLRYAQGLLADAKASLLGFASEPGTGATVEQRVERDGLLASACKREAHLLFKLGAPPKEWRAKLADAREWYREGARASLNSHWNAVQYLSLSAVLDGTLRDQGRWWSAAEIAIEFDQEMSTDPASRVWALGSLIELHLLRPLIDEALFAPSQTAALEDTARFIAATRPDAFAVKSTWLQVRRYLDWWWQDVDEASAVGRVKLIAATIAEKLEAHRDRQG